VIEDPAAGEVALDPIRAREIEAWPAWLGTLA